MGPFHFTTKLFVLIRPVGLSSLMFTTSNRPVSALKGRLSFPASNLRREIAVSIVALVVRGKAN